jgi:hypothetical protein
MGALALNPDGMGIPLCRTANQLIRVVAEVLLACSSSVPPGLAQTAGARARPTVMRRRWPRPRTPSRADHGAAPELGLRPGDRDATGTLFNISQ